MRNAGCLALTLLLAGCGYEVPPEDGTGEDIDDDADEADTDEYEPPEEPGNDWFVDMLAGLAWRLSGGGGGGSDHARPAPAPSPAARADLVRTADSPDGDARGVVAVGRRSRRERFGVRVAGLAPGAPVELFAGDRFDVPVAVAAGSCDGRGTISFSPEFLPAGAASLEEMAGRRVELRDGSGRTLLRGRVPALRGRGPDHRASRGYRDGATGVRVKASLAAVRSVGRQVLRVEVRGLAASAPAELRFLARDGRMAPVAAGEADGSGRFSLRADSREGDPVPAGEEWIESLGGRPFEVSSGGEIVAEGELPPL